MSSTKQLVDVFKKLSVCQDAECSKRHDKSSKLCIYEDCKTTSCFNYPNEKPLFCNKHKKDGMINIKHKNIKCMIDNCEVYPSYNFPGEKVRLYCKIHALEGMIDVVNKVCIEDGCTKLASYNYEGQKVRLYCSNHRKENMMNIKNKKCIEEGCLKTPSYNYERESLGLYCLLHKKDTMINIVSKSCIVSSCKIRPIFNFPNEISGSYCKHHKTEEMVDVFHRNKKCLEEGCNKQATFNYSNKKEVSYCSTHKKYGMVDVKNKSCKNEWCFTKANKKYDNYCCYCYINMFPDKPISRNYKTKERTVVDEILKEFPDYDWKLDKVIEGGCSRRRPDMLVDLGYQVIIIEIDENQHIDYDCTCENKRIMELSQDLDHRPIIFIRFNPDDYKEGDKNIPSCWILDKNNMLVIKKTKQKEWDERMKSLKDQIKYWIDPENKTEKTLEIIQLFYDV